MLYAVMYSTGNVHSSKNLVSWPWHHMAEKLPFISRFSKHAMVYMNMDAKNTDWPYRVQRSDYH